MEIVNNTVILVPVVLYNVLTNNMLSKFGNIWASFVGLSSIRVFH